MFNRGKDERERQKEQPQYIETKGDQDDPEIEGDSSFDSDKMLAVDEMEMDEWDGPEDGGEEREEAGGAGGITQPNGRESDT